MFLGARISKLFDECMHKKMQNKIKDTKQNWISVSKYYLNQKSIAHLLWKENHIQGY